MGVPGFRRYLVFYQYWPDQSLVRVVHVLHAARDVETLLFDELS